LLNSDARIDVAGLSACLDALEAHPRAGIVGPQLVDEGGRPSHSVHPFPSLATELVPRFAREILWPGSAPSRRALARSGPAPRAVDAVLGAALFVRRSCLEQIGRLDEGYFFYLEETDLCLRAGRAGWHVLFVPGARVVHLSGASSKSRWPARSRVEYAASMDRFLRKHRGPGVARVSRVIRAVQAGLGFLLSASLPGARRRPGGRFESRRALWLWHVRGRPKDAGLRGLDAGPPAAPARAGTTELEACR